MLGTEEGVQDGGMPVAHEDLGAAHQIPREVSSAILLCNAMKSINRSDDETASEKGGQC